MRMPMRMRMRLRGRQKARVHPIPANPICIWGCWGGAGGSANGGADRDERIHRPMAAQTAMKG
jgi:hypothetical protein